MSDHIDELPVLLARTRSTIRANPKILCKLINN